MFHCTYRAHTIDILKCAKCRSYAFDLVLIDRAGDLDDYNTYSFTCLDCDNQGQVRIGGGFKLESFSTWDELQERIDELKIAMTVTDLE